MPAVRLEEEEGWGWVEGGKHFYSGSIILKENVELYLEQVGTPVTLKPS
ncbi:MAG: hypothetical protein ACLVD8_10870 [Enterocloster sp.]